MLHAHMCSSVQEQKYLLLNIRTTSMILVREKEYPNMGHFHTLSKSFQK